MKTLVLCLALALSAFGQTAQYPGTVASDTHLKIARNNVRTSLRLPMSATDTVITVADASEITAGMLLTVDREVVNVLSVLAGNNLSVQRGFDSTVAASHSAGRPIQANVTAWHHNALVEEIQAIEKALDGSTGGGSSNNAASYDFSPQSPGGSLIAGNNVITVAPVPVGVNGSDVAHYLYVYDGTGTPEACLITGGTAVSGGTSGTLIIQCANAHSGAWKIKSATAGVVEGWNIVKSLRLPASTTPYHFYGTATAPWGGTLTCDGTRGTGIIGVTQLEMHNDTATMFRFVNDAFGLQGCALIHRGNPTSNAHGVYIAGQGSDTSVPSNSYADTGWIRDLSITGFYHGVHIAGVGGSVDLSNVNVYFSVHDGFYALSAQGYWNGIVSQHNGGNGFTFGMCPRLGLPGGCGTNPMSSSLQSFNNKGWGLKIYGQSQIAGGNSYFNYDLAGEVHLEVSGGLADFIVQGAGKTFTVTNHKGVSIPGATNPAAIGLYVDNGSSAVHISQGQFDSNEGTGIVVDGHGIVFNSIVEASSGLSGVNKHGIILNAPAYISSSKFFSPAKFTGATGSIISGNTFYGGTASIPSVEITGSSLHVTFTDNVLSNATGTTLKCDAGSSLGIGANMLFGTPVNNCTASGASFPNF